ncbi:MAG TPA: type II toxin-antitoxin system PemK/MazF family toxin [Fimbriimonas sp.]|nr:type II toxin-antitoxin system PemK/MazF family toxin [Fimbriimonas sp.]
MLFRHDFGPRRNSIQEGPRPLVVVQTDALNKLDGYPLVIVVPLTTKRKPSATFVQIEPSEQNQLTSTSWAITNQVFTIAKDDLREPIGRVSKTELYGIKDGLKIAFAIS